ncbi:MAG: GntR family transcriptional regulator [Actinomycetales bacterium]
MPEVHEHGSTSIRLAEVLREAMFEGRLEPGDPLREVALAAEHGVARSTVREALQMLALEGLVTRVPNRGAEVTSLSDDEIDEIFKARRLLEVMGIRSVTTATASAMRALRRSYDRYAEAVAAGDRPQITSAHLAFHNSLVGLLGSRRLLDTAESLTADLRLIMAAVNRLRDDAPEQVTEHERLLLALEAGDMAAAEREIAAHLTRATSQLAMLLERQRQLREEG